MTTPSSASEPEARRMYSSLTTVSRGVGRRVRSPPWLARAAGVGLAAVSLAFLAGFAVALGNHGLTLFVSKPPTMRAVLALPYLVVVLTAGTTVGAALAWRRRYWSWTGRIHQTVLAVLGLAFVWQLFALGFLP